MVINVPKNVMLHKDYVIGSLGSRFLIYPLNTSFIKNLEPSHIDKWLQAGWSIDSTVLLELSHPTLPPSGNPSTSPTSSLFSGVICAWRAGKYYRFVAFAKEYFRNIDQINLKIDCWHEQRHLRSAEEFMYDGSSPLNEEDVAEEEVKHVYEMFGEEGTRTRSEHISTIMDQGRDADAIPGYVAVLWLREFFEYKIANYRSKSLPIPQNQYTARMREESNRMAQAIMSTYQRTLQVNPKALFKYSARTSLQI
jgi:hypothetical protein